MLAQSLFFNLYGNSSNLGVVFGIVCPQGVEPSFYLPSSHPNVLLGVGSQILVGQSKNWVLSKTDGDVSVQDTFMCDVRGVTVFSLITQTTSEEQAVSKYLEH